MKERRLTLEEKRKLGLYRYENYYCRKCIKCGNEFITARSGIPICPDCEWEARYPLVRRE